MTTEPWIGVDLDGTLALYHGWKNELHIGDPVPIMAARVSSWLAAGHRVKIFTARVSPKAGKAVVSVEAIRERIQMWTLVHFGIRLEVTCEKDYAMTQLWDDRAIQIIENTGLRADGHK